MSQWQKVSLGEVLQKSEDWIQLHPNRTYKEVTVRLWGKGATLRKEIGGAEIASATRLQVHVNQFIISRIDARNGASGLIPEELEGAVVSNDFPVFTPVPNRLDPHYLGWLSKTKSFVELCKAASEGTTNRVRLKEERFVAMQIALPPLPEQRRLVERIDALAAKIEEARKLRHEAASSRVSLWLSALESGFANLTSSGQLLATILRRKKREVVLQAGAEYLPAGITNQAKGIISYPPITCNDTKYTSLFELAEGDLVYSKLKVWEGSLAIVPSEGKGRVVSSEFPMFEVAYDRVHPEYLDLWLRRPSLWKWLGDQVRGIGGRKIRVDEPTFLKAPIPLPPIAEQVAIAARLQGFRRKTLSVKELQEDSEVELEVMLPAILDRAFRGEL